MAEGCLGQRCRDGGAATTRGEDAEVAGPGRTSAATRGTKAGGDGRRCVCPAGEGGLIRHARAPAGKASSRSSDGPCEAIGRRFAREAPEPRSRGVPPFSAVLEGGGPAAPTAVSTMGRTVSQR